MQESAGKDESICILEKEIRKYKVQQELYEQKLKELHSLHMEDHKSHELPIAINNGSKDEENLQIKIQNLEDLIKARDIEIFDLKQLLKEHLDNNDKIQLAFKKLNSNLEQNTRIEPNLMMQIASFDAMKHKLMQELQDRSDQVVELQALLQKAQYDAEITDNQTNKIEALNKNLEQLKVIQKQLLDQNRQNKHELELKQRKIDARNERIAKLEAENLDYKNQLEERTKEQNISCNRMNRDIHVSDGNESTLLTHKNSLSSNFSNWIQSSKIAKPLRGGIALAAEPCSPVGSQKNSAWYISLVKK
jgi:kinesin family protein 5